MLDGPTHRYMTATPACYKHFTDILAAEYSNALLTPAHRMTVDTYGVQHPGGDQRRQIQSVGLHLARLCMQLDTPMPPRETNDVMLGFSARKSTLIQLEPPKRFTLTAADIAPFAGGPKHMGKIREWARATWHDWAPHHAYIRDWIAQG